MRRSGTRRALLPSPGNTLIGYWPMNEGSGTTFVDVIGGRNMTITDASGSWLTGGNLGFNFFTGGIAETSVTGAPFTGITTQTVFLWVNSSVQGANGNHMVAVYDFGNSNRVWTIQSDVGGSAVMRVTLVDDGVGGIGAHTKSYVGSQTCIDATLHSVAYRWNNGTLSLFVDGVKDTSPTLVSDGSFTTLWPINATVPLGCNVLYNSGSPIGTIETNGVLLRGLRIYRNAVSDVDMARIHALGPN